MKPEKKIFYMDGVDWQHEIGETRIVVHKTIKGLKENSACWRSCGIVRVEMKAVWVEPQDLWKGLGDEPDSG